MHCFRRARIVFQCSVIRKQDVTSNIVVNMERCSVLKKRIYKSLYTSAKKFHEETVAKALRVTKPKSQINRKQGFTDIKQVRAVGGRGGDGEISFLQLWVNDRAGPDGGDGGNGGHVIFEASMDVKDLSHISSQLIADSGEKGYSKDCFGKNAEHLIVKVPTGTIVRDTQGKILADLDQLGVKFIAARGGAGGHGNAFFKSNMQQTPKICEYGANGEELQYVLEIKSMAHIGLVGLPNAGKSTLLRAISRAKPKVAAYPFTTLKPHLGIILYDDYEQITVADLPGLIAGSHKNKGLGIQFLKHVERCAVLLLIVDITSDEPWSDLETLKYEIEQFNVKLNKRPFVIVANKIDLPTAEENLKMLRQRTDIPIIPISAKMGTNLSTLLGKVRILYDSMKEKMPHLSENST